eukprot:CAMPEP_0168170144 /NCGR_PEP_ID=MMETSP0139_2-20121125/4017_1 /TAXON_ID=44445 /ORGANISM="Pseudo-nitzschia australis, Strain 10249 10 AB" /LENGTH=225 /DNA_ID=CAMNT_0008087615 /DNA_START=166 /DNA_END=844 /DNA_ORIENTATION=+
MYQVEGAGISYIPKGTMMAAAQHAFCQAINKKKAQQINDRWETISDKFLLKKTITEAIYELFKEHYTKHLKDWSRNILDPNSTTGKANVLVEHTNELADLRETLQNVVTNRNHLQDQYTNQVEAGYNAYQLPPSVVTAPTSATASTTANSVAPSIVVYPDFESILQRALQTQAALTKKAIANSRRLIPKQQIPTGLHSATAKAKLTIPPIAVRGVNGNTGVIPVV